MATVTEARLQPQGLRRPGLLSKALPGVGKGLPSRPNELLLRRGINSGDSPRDSSPLTIASAPDLALASSSRDEKQLPAKPLPTPPAISQQPATTLPPRGSSLSPRLNNQGRPSPLSLPATPKPASEPLPTKELPLPRKSLSPTKRDIPIEDFIPEPELKSPQKPAEPFMESNLAVNSNSTVASISNYSNSSPNSNPNSNSNSTTNLARLDSDTSNEPYVPPVEENITAPPLTKIHYACYQSHRSMPTSNNVWYAVPCMTCQKVDQEVRHRCTFCCLRVCRACYESLQKCANRSLAELMAKSYSG